METLYIALFYLLLAGHPYGTMMDPTPVPRDVCINAITSPEVQERVKAIVKQDTGDDVDVDGACQPVE